MFECVRKSLAVKLICLFKAQEVFPNTGTVLFVGVILLLNYAYTLGYEQKIDTQLQVCRKINAHTHTHTHAGFVHTCHAYKDLCASTNTLSSQYVGH